MRLPHTETMTITDTTPDYNGLEIKFLVLDGEAQRNIHIDPELELTDNLKEPSRKRHSFDSYYAFDDDAVRGEYVAYDEHDEKDKSKTCRRNQEYRFASPTCNNAHEQELIEGGIEFLGAGAFREVFAIDHATEKATEHVVIKDLRFDAKVDYEGFEYVRMDALVAERLSSNPRIFDIYGFCGLSILSQFFWFGDIEDIVVTGSGYKRELQETEEELKPENELTPIQKLVLALEMAKGLEALHGHTNGLIIHDDVQLSQYLFNDDRSMIILNDFNRAEMPLWDEENQEYCRYKNGRGAGNWRSPEEYADKPLTEQIDIWSTGCNFLSLLTGLYPIYTIQNYKKYAQEILDHNLPKLDPRYKERSKEERILAELVQRIFVWDPADRPSIFELVDILQKSVDECLGPDTSTASVLQSIGIPDSSSSSSSNSSDD